MTKQQEELVRFIAPGKEPVAIVLTRGGHSASVTDDPEGTPLHARFHRQAVMLGCMPLGLQTASVKEDVANARKDRSELLQSCIAALVSEASEDEEKRKDYFTNDGRPDTRAMAVRLGFPVSAADRDDAWAIYTGEGSE